MFSRIQKRILLTCAIILFYSALWMALEMWIYGAIINRTVDNIIMLLFIPIIWIATGRIPKAKE